MDIKGTEKEEIFESFKKKEEGFQMIRALESKIEVP